MVVTDSEAAARIAIDADHGRWLLPITCALAEAVAEEAVHAAIVDHAASALDATGCALWLRDAHVLRLVRHVGPLPHPAELAIDGSLATPVVDAVRSLEPIWTGRAHYLPLVVAGAAVGAIAIDFGAEREASANERRCLLLVAHYAARALERLRTVAADDARRLAEQLYRFANTAVCSETLDQVFEAALTAIVEAMRTHRASILLFEDDGVMRFRAWRGLTDRYRAAVEGHSPWTADAESPQPVLVGDFLRDAAWSSYEAVFRAEAIAAVAFIPLVSRGRLIGKFMVYYAAPHAFTTSEVEVARAIANHLAALVARFRAIAELERNVRDNDLFAGVLAHDLRNPLGAVVTATQIALMNATDSDERVTRPLGRILTSADRMSKMIAQLLDFTRARVGGGIAISPVRTSMLDIAKQTIGELELVHPDRELVVLQAHGDESGMWDYDRLLQVVSNLVGNACQHGAAGRVTIGVDGGSSDGVALTVHNAGAIPAALQPRLFDPFRGREDRRGDARGLGLGLFIVREIVRAHHGTIEVVSTEAEGTTFVVRLPRR